MTQTNLEQNARPGPVALFVSDLHLQESMPATTAAFLTFLHDHAIKAKQLYLLGDIFEYWAGDDDLDSPFPQKIAQALRDLVDAGVELFWMAGNRDFLVGQGFSAATGARLLADPFILDDANQPILLSHGDQLCTDDVQYQQFRQMVRQPRWQAEFLARPLAERKSMIAAMRAQSKQHQQQASVITDVNQTSVDQFFATHHVQTLIHGHTHRPAAHHVGNTVRHVLSDWDCDHAAPRGDWLALEADGSLWRVNLDGAAFKE